MRKVILAILSVAMLAACQPKGYQVSGTIEGVEDGKKVMVSCLRNGRQVIVDSTVIGNGQFYIEGEVKTPEIYFISCEGVQQPISFFIENCDISISAKASNMFDAEISGSALSDKMTEFEKSMPDRERLREISQEYMQAQMGRDVEEIAALDIEIGELIPRQTAYAEGFIRDNISNPLGLFVLQNIAEYMDAFTRNELAQQLRVNLKGHPYLIDLNGLLEQLDAYEKSKAEAMANEESESTPSVTEEN